ncbi:hypothetical protein PGT21_003047 [Puccinia graminis f. sp. tritici]|uniref:Phospholipid/glycerol acyltransferase domain-containing protein n=1 Tax=Puccinia graminis f. sp. tritici TaxID=56615 RepID=A0A5B0LKM4_PUCGR|nr:hypothetical protein PGT21_003047 [Puccinia graminis f. sp. tritici]
MESHHHQDEAGDEVRHRGGDDNNYHVPNYPTETPIAYHAVISFFRFVLAIFFSRIVIENPDRIPGNGRPTIVLVNHSNSLTDALIIMASVPRHARRMLRMTAKATHFRKPTFSSWLIEKAGSVPLQRAQDYQPETRIDNSGTRELLMNALCQQGDAICIFPEGISRYHPALAPFKTGAARIASDVLCQFKNQEKFEINLLPCSITYLHRQNFRSDVLVSFHDPIVLRSSDPTNAELVASDPECRKQGIAKLTATLTEKIRAGTLDSPSWDLIKAANMARTLYAPFGTQLSLGTHIRLTQRFVDVFAGRTPSPSSTPSPTSPQLSPSNHTELVKDLLDYQQMLFHLGLKDARLANNRLVSRRVILTRLAFRVSAAAFFLSICAPGLCFWIPTFIVTGYFAHRQRLKGPAWDTYDEVTQTKMLWGLASGLATYGCVLLVCLPIFPLVLIVFPIWMWFTLRWLEDLVATLRATRSLVKMLMISKDELKSIRAHRARLEKEVTKLAVDRCMLPGSNEDVLKDDQQQEIVIKNGRVTNSRFDYFSIRRRRKKDYNEVLRLWDLVDM